VDGDARWVVRRKEATTTSPVRRSFHPNLSIGRRGTTNVPDASPFADAAAFSTRTAIRHEASKRDGDDSLIILINKFNLSMYYIHLFTELY
jgi:hypothetical protein